MDQRIEVKPSLDFVARAVCVGNYTDLLATKSHFLSPFLANSFKSFHQRTRFSRTSTSEQEKADGLSQLKTQGNFFVCMSIEGVVVHFDLRAHEAATSDLGIAATEASIS